MIYRSPNISDLPYISELHMNSFPGTFISSLGDKLIQNYYKEYIKEDNLFIVAENNNKIVGFCMGYKVGSKAREKFIKNNFIRLFTRITKQIISFNKLTISKCLLLLLPKKQKKRLFNGDLLSICVTQDFRGSGLAQELIHEFETLLLENNILDYSLCVYKSNTRAINFYKKNGLSIFEENDNDFKMYKQITR